MKGRWGVGRDFAACFDILCGVPTTAICDEVSESMIAVFLLFA
jgi:hypothetical protein